MWARDPASCTISGQQEAGLFHHQCHLMSSVQCSMSLLLTNSIPHQMLRQARPVLANMQRRSGLPGMAKHLMTTSVLSLCSAEPLTSINEDIGWFQISMHNRGIILF